MIEVKCKHCGRFIGEVEMIVGNLSCPNSSCKGSTNFKILSDKPMYNYKFVKPEKQPKEKRNKNE